jgi:hypothetical protein
MPGWLFVMHTAVAWFGLEVPLACAMPIEGGHAAALHSSSPMAAPVVDSSRKKRTGTLHAGRCTLAAARWTLDACIARSNMTDQSPEASEQMSGLKRTNIDPFRPLTVKLSLTDHTSPPTQYQGRNKRDGIGLVSPFIHPSPFV